MTLPLEFSIDVPLSREEAFALFTERMSSWWPLHDHSIYTENAERVDFEPHVGGKITEVSRDGERYVWGELLEVERPNRLLFTWHPGTDAASEVELTFVELPSGGTRVVLEHRGWEAFGEQAEEMRAGYANGWPYVFVQRFGDAARKVVV